MAGQLSTLERLAGEVALVAPLRQGTSSSAYIPWSIVLEIREALEAAGYDWRALHAQARTIANERKTK